MKYMKRAQASKYVLGLFIFSFLASEALAGPFRIVDRSCPAGFETQCNDAFDELEVRVNNDLPDADQSTYLKGMSNSSVMSMKANGVDYANDIDLFVVGVSVGAGIDVGNNSFSDFTSGDVDGNQIRGIGIAPSLMVGTNLGLFNLPKMGFFDPSRVRLMANFFTMNIGSFGDDLDGKVTNLGFHARYRVFEPKSFVPGGLLRWNGLDVTTGLEYSSLDLKYIQTFKEEEEVDGFDVEIDGTVTAGADVSTTSIPIVVSTGMQLGYILTTYTGFGFDINLGSATSLAEVNADITGDAGAEGTGELNLGDKDGPTSIFTRGFVGFQLNFPIIKLYAQLDKSFNESVYGINGGLRLTW